MTTPAVKALPQHKKQFRFWKSANMVHKLPIAGITTLTSDLRLKVWFDLTCLRMLALIHIALGVGGGGGHWQWHWLPKTLKSGRKHCVGDSQSACVSRIVRLLGLSPSPRRNSGLLHVCTRGSQHKAQKEIWLVSGLQDHGYLSVKK